MNGLTDLGLYQDQRLRKAQSPHPQHQSPLLNLPPELRDLILSHLLADLRLQIDFRHIDLSLPTVLTLGATCRVLRAELRDAIHFHAVRLIRQMRTTTLLYPFTRDAWAADLPFKGRLCDVCAPASYTLLGASCTLGLEAVGPMQPLECRIVPCACRAGRLPARRGRAESPCGGSEVASTAPAHQQPTPVAQAISWLLPTPFWVKERWLVG
ncbi:hypothetical protein LTR53_013994 [Teratosphaeriaceae sp. CCFEE 6253]|nr:hypothetical protein LTR53_013994 [Teratosphaeriaceae sp. CCFEE 6253]